MTRYVVQDVTKNTRETAAAGTLPLASRPTMRQAMVFFSPWTNDPAIFVAAVKSRSVPTAVVGCIPKTSTSNGVISAAPPTPVIPTKRPTPAPDKMYKISIGIRAFQRAPGEPDLAGVNDHITLPWQCNVTAAAHPAS